MTSTATTTASNNPAANLFTALNPAATTTTSTAATTQTQFLTLLTTQLKNQDPLNPMDNAQMTSQLAQISTVEGLDKLNNTLTGLIDSQSQTQTLQAASLVGKGVLTAGSKLTLASGNAVGGFTLAGAADSATVTIKDASGNKVRTMTFSGVDAGTTPFAWDGSTDAGNTAAPDGNYTFSVTATQGSNSVTATALQYGLVNSVAGTSSGLAVNVGAVGNVKMSDIMQIL